MTTTAPCPFAVMRRFGIPKWRYIREDGRCIYTSAGTIEDWCTRPRMAAVDRRPLPGNNETGHRLPASST